MIFAMKVFFKHQLVQTNLSLISVH